MKYERSPTFLEVSTKLSFTLKPSFASDKINNIDMKCTQERCLLKGTHTRGIVEILLVWFIRTSASFCLAWWVTGYRKGRYGLERNKQSNNGKKRTKKNINKKPGLNKEGEKMNLGLSGLLSDWRVFFSNLCQGLLLLSLFLSFESLSHQCWLENKFTQVSRTFLSILIYLNNAVVWMVSTRPLISKSSSPFNNPLVTVPSKPIITGISVTFMFHSGFFSVL